jgi:uroporphyrinogen decarboxylase
VNNPSPEPSGPVTGKRMLNALQGIPVDRPPFWFMRQAGRYLPEYREIRGTAGGFLDLCYNPDFATEVTLQPIRRFGMDAAILFADILLVCDALGQGLSYQEGEGPVLEPIRTVEDINRLEPARCPEILSPVYDTVSKLSACLPAETTLIGFAGAPWTVAAYMVEGHGSKDFAVPRLWALRDAEGFAQLIDLIVDVTIEYLSQQIKAGAEAVQLFDSWAGLVPAASFDRWCIQPVKAITSALKQRHPDVPVIGFPRGAGPNLMGYMAKTGVDALSLDQSIDPKWAAQYVQPEGTLQGNLDPLSVVSGGDAMIDQAAQIMDAMAGGSLVFNLGHGLVPQTPPEHVEALSEWLRNWTR